MSKNTPSAQKAATPPKNFESAMRELEEIAERLESGDAPLEEMIAAYQRGATLVEYCSERLRAARGKIKKLEEKTLIGMDDVGE